MDNTEKTKASAATYDKLIGIFARQSVIWQQTGGRRVPEFRNCKETFRGCDQNSPIFKDYNWRQPPGPPCPAQPD